MRQLLTAVVCVLTAFAVSGCRSGNNGVVKTTNQGVQLPDFLVGVWEADSAKYDWGFKFESDGTISKMVHFLAGEVDMSEGGYFVEGKDPNTHAFFIMGPSTVTYDPNTRQLRVEVVLDDFEMQLPQGVLNGRSHDILEGPVSETGKAWEVAWESYQWLEGGEPPDPNLIKAYPERLTFIKLDL